MRNPDIGRGALMAALSSVSVLAGGCGLLAPLGVPEKVGPDYLEAETSSAERWIDYSDARIDQAAPDLATWWSIFGDPALDGLMRRAVDGNLSLQAAVERVAASRARRDLAVGFQYPQQQGASGSVTDNELSEETANFDGELDSSFREWGAGIGAVWEIDLWGRFARAVEAADAELQASIAERDSVQVLLYAEIAASYVSYRTLQERLRFLRENVRIQQGTYDIAKDRFDVGDVPERDVFQAVQAREETRARIPGVEADLRREANNLCVLTGSIPRDLTDQLGDAPIPKVPSSVLVGIPADLVRRRPDVRRAERLAAARCALIGIAESDYYPRFSLTGSLGISAEHFSDLDTSDAAESLLGLSFSWSLFDWNRTASSVRFREAEYRAAVLDYQNAVLLAGAEVEDALITWLKAQETVRARGAAAAAAQRIVEVGIAQYNEGLVDYLTVFVFTRSLTDAQDLLADAQGVSAFALVDLYRALGGGWTSPPEDPVRSEGESP